MSRKDELIKLIDNNTALLPLVDEMLYLEEQLDYYRTLPKIKVHPNDPSKQKATPAAKLYKEYLQQYINIVKVLQKATGADDLEEESPLRLWMNAHVNQK